MGKKNGFIKRQRKVTGSNFVKTLLFAWLQNHSPSVEGLARAAYTHGLNVSAQGVDKRFTQKACEFMKSVLEEAVAQVIVADDQIDMSLLNHFTAVYLADCSTVSLPAEWSILWQGVGGTEDAGQAAMKLDTRLELKTGGLHIGLLPGRHSDSRSPVAEAIYEPGSLRLQDLGYFNLSRMKAQHERGEYWLSRLQPRTRVLTMDGRPIDLQALLKQGVTRHEMKVQVGASGQLEARLLIWKLPEQARAKRRAKMNENARKHGRTLTAESLAWCDWNFLITNVGAEKLNFDECFVLYGVRWQIELLFKLWKTHGKLGHSRSENPQRMLCEVYAKLLGVLIQHWAVLTGLWQIQERSLVKGCQMIREQSARLAACINDFGTLVDLLKEWADRFKYGCSQNPRKKKPNTSQCVDRGYAFS
ncbi:MAG: IS4 family transposase [Methylobacter sp.]